MPNWLSSKMSHIRPHFYITNTNWQICTSKQRKNRCLFHWFQESIRFNLAWRIIPKTFRQWNGGKFYDLIKSMYTASQCAVKIGNQRTELFPQGRGVRQGCSLSPTLFNIYINQLANILEHAPFKVSLYTTQRKSVFSTQMTWSSCRPLKRGFRTAWICWRISVSPGPWRSTSKKLESWCSRNAPDLRDQHTHSH